MVDVSNKMHKLYRSSKFAQISILIFYFIFIICVEMIEEKNITRTHGFYYSKYYLEDQENFQIIQIPLNCWKQFSWVSSHQKNNIRICHACKIMRKISLNMLLIWSIPFSGWENYVESCVPLIQQNPSELNFSNVI